MNGAKIVCEGTIQAVLMRWLMNVKNHEYIIPNSNQFFSWEADLISVTKSDLVHEFEIKLNIYDYRADAKKSKHARLGRDFASPAYFWYATYDFEITPPDNAGWILITKDNKNGWVVSVKKDAPMLNRWKIDQRRRDQITRLLSWRLANFYENQYLRNIRESEKE